MTRDAQHLIPVTPKRAGKGNQKFENTIFKLHFIHISMLRIKSLLLTRSRRSIAHGELLQT